MSSVGRRPTLYELIEALHAIERIEADFSAVDPKSETFRVILTFQRAQCPYDWREGQPKPSWMFDQIMEELQAWLLQRNKEEQWVSKEEEFGTSIDTLMAHWVEELKKTMAIRPENMLTRMQKKIFSNTILRLRELKERRDAGAVYSAVNNRREKASKAWMEDEYEAPKREEAQRRAHEHVNRGGPFGFSKEFEDMQENMRRQAEEMYRGFYGGFGYRDFDKRGDWEQHFNYTNPNGDYKRTTPPTGKRPWYEILGVKVGANKADIQKAYRKLAAKFHPDRYKEPDASSRMTEINTARDEGLEGL